MKPLILITNDDGVAAKGLLALCGVAREYGDVVVMAPERNASGLSHSITSWRPLRAREVRQEEGLSVYCCDGINHGSNSSINVLYSGTMGAVMEATTLGFNAIGFSLLNHNPEADFSGCLPSVNRIVDTTLKQGLPANVALNVNIPRLSADEIKGIRICRQAHALWSDSFEKRTDPQGRPYWWLTGKFICPEPPQDSDEWALTHGYVSVVPISPDFTHHPSINELTKAYD